MWTKLLFVSLNLMKQRSNNSRMQLRTVIGLNSSLVCFELYSSDVFIRYQFVKASVYLMVKIPLLCLCFLPSVSLYHAAWVCACGFFFGGLHDLLNYILEVSFVYWDAHCLLFCPFVSGLWSLGFWLQVQMICHYGVCIHWTYIVVLFSQFDWIIYSWIYPYLYFRFCGWIASW